ncbi:MAG: hypothetical protein P1P87_06430 [Trueperaceae bacterium]|nr:hypothetical protein [Trueperaceae bacterium]
MLEPVRPWSRRRRAAIVAVLVAVASAGVLALAQTPPDAELPVLHPEALALMCPERTWTTPPTAAQLAAAAARDAYRAMLPAYLARVPSEPGPVLWMPVDGVRVA